MAQGLAVAKLHQESLVFYEPLLTLEESVSPELYLELGRSYRALGAHGKAEECFQNCIQLDEDHIDARVQLAEMYEELKLEEQAFLYVNEIMALRRQKNVPIKPRKPRRRKAAPDSADDATAKMIPKLAAKTSMKAKAKANTTATSGSIAGVDDDVEKTADGDAAAYSDSHTYTDDDDGGGSGSGSATADGDAFVATKRARKLYYKPRRLADPSERRKEEDMRKQRLLEQYDVMQQVGARMRRGERQATKLWMEAARDLIADFRSCKFFYPWDKYVQFLGYKGPAARKKASADNTEVDPLDANLDAMADRLSHSKCYHWSRSTLC